MLGSLVYGTYPVCHVSIEEIAGIVNVGGFGCLVAVHLQSMGERAPDYMYTMDR
jgi:hypothetical protein